MPTKTDYIKSQYQQGEAAAGLASRLNAPITIDNPEPQQQIIKPPDLAVIRASISDGEAFAVMETRTYDRLLDALSKQDYIAVNNHVLALHGGGKISAETLQKIAALFQDTIPDPGYQAKLQTTLAKQAGFTITVQDCAEALS